MQRLPQFIAAVLVLAGICIAIFGKLWGPPVYAVLDRSELGTWLGLVVPFLPMALIAGGAALYVHARRSNSK